MASVPGGIPVSLGIEFLCLDHGPDSAGRQGINFLLAIRCDQSPERRRKLLSRPEVEGPADSPMRKTLPRSCQKGRRLSARDCFRAWRCVTESEVGIRKDPSGRFGPRSAYRGYRSDGLSIARWWTLH